MSEPYVGEIRMVGFNYAPRGWAMCNGAILSIQEFPALFSLLGTTYGGNGNTTFGLPDLRGRVPLNEGEGPGISRLYPLGEKAGAERISLTSADLPAHTHGLSETVPAQMAVTVPAYSQGGNNSAPGGDRVLAAMGSGVQAVNGYSSETPDTSLAPVDASGALQLDGQTGVVGNGTPVNVMQPYLVVNIIIATEGVFPPRS